ncbi:hypothetical protein [Parasphingorhabdus sp.]|uniref:hypothetical protein n=1 Tax=Parasphingorhabdus sp. TaxID=2709688 RepID=UPI003264CFCD
MKLALISLLDDGQDNSGPPGLQNIFDGSVLEQQVQFVRELGAETILLISAAIPGALMQRVDAFRQQDIDVKILRNGADLAKYGSEEGQFLFLGDGVLPGNEVRNALCGDGPESVFVVDNAEQYSDYERVDLTHRWLGVAVLDTSRLQELEAIPEDWDVGSALLRTAVQSGCQREVMTDDQIESGAIYALRNSDAISEYVQHKLHDHDRLRGNFLERFVTWPLARIGVRTLGAMKNAGQYLGVATTILGVFACVTAWFAWPVPTLVLLIIAQLVRKQREAFDIFSTDVDRHQSFSSVAVSIWSAALLILTVKISIPTVVIPNAVIMAGLLLNILAANKLSNNNKLEMFRPDLMLVLLLALTGGFFGQVFTGFYAGFLISALYLGLDTYFAKPKS